MTRSTRILLMVLAVVVAGAAVKLYYDHVAKARAHEAAVAQCGAVALRQWRKEYGAGMSEFGRAAEAAGMAPRIAIAPLILRVSEAEAKLEGLKPPPCAAQAVARIREGLRTQSETLKSFAMDAATKSWYAERFELAAQQVAEGVEMLKVADAQAVE